MKHVMRMALIVGVAVGAWAVSSDRGYTQSADPNAAPNPYKMQDNFFQLPQGRKFGGAIKVQVDHSDGKSIWVFDRCEEANCNPIQKFDETVPELWIDHDCDCVSRSAGHSFLARIQ